MAKKTTKSATTDPLAAKAEKTEAMAAASAQPDNAATAEPVSASSEAPKAGDRPAEASARIELEAAPSEDQPSLPPPSEGNDDAGKSPIPADGDNPTMPGAAPTAIESARRNPLLAWLSSRAAMLAIAAGVGALIGSTVSNGLGYAVAVATADRDAVDPNQALRASVSQLTAEIASLKALVAGGDKASAIVLSGPPRIFDGADGPNANTPKVASLDDDPAPVSTEITGSIGPTPVPIANKWTLWRVQNGRALVEGDSGYYEVAPGSRLPGLGMVQRIVRHGGGWAVETRNGLILPRG